MNSTDIHQGRLADQVEEGRISSAIFPKQLLLAAFTIVAEEDNNDDILAVGVVVIEVLGCGKCKAEPCVQKLCLPKKVKTYFEYFLQHGDDA